MYIITDFAFDMEANVSSSFTRVATKILNATQYTLTNLTVGTTSSGNMITKEEGTMSHRKYFMHFVSTFSRFNPLFCKKMTRSKVNTCKMPICNESLI